MASAFDGMINDIMAEVERQRAKLVSMQEGFGGLTGYAEAKRRQLSVTVDGRGEILDLTFKGTSYRTMPPKELASLIVDTVQRAQRNARDALYTSMSGEEPGTGEGSSWLPTTE